MNPVPYLKIIRYSNALMAGLTVFLGFWLTKSQLSVFSVMMLMFATICSTGFGNVINDIQDIDSDRISHPERPLPSGDISTRSAWCFSLFLFIAAIASSFSVSSLHGTATLLPLGLLILYAFYLKGTPLAGNIVVATLVAYTIIYGALGAPDFSKLLLPASLAFLLNISREIIKDIQDSEGDRLTGIVTSATIPQHILRVIIFICSFIYFVLLILTIGLKQFGIIYSIIVLAIATPLHLYRTILLNNRDWEKKLKKISGLFKLEMLSGLVALAADRIFR